MHGGPCFLGTGLASGQGGSEKWQLALYPYRQNYLFEVALRRMHHVTSYVSYLLGSRRQ